jgi:thioredoxin-like negative regulator of GroEL
MLDAKFLQSKFEAALSYDRYIATGTDEQRARWKPVYDVTKLSAAQKALLETFTREMKILCISGIWCGDCVQQVPLIQRIAEANPTKVQLRILDRDEHKDLSERVKICAGLRVPTLLLLAEDFEFCGIAGDRTLSRYRAIAKRKLGAACATGIGAPEQDEMAATIQDWVDEIERVQLMLRLSPRLREKHGD